MPRSRNESMVEENVQIKLNSNLFAVFNDGTTITPILQCKVQWSMSMSQNDFDAILLKEVVSENVRFSSKAAANVKVLKTDPSSYTPFDALFIKFTSSIVFLLLISKIKRSSSAI